MTVWKRDFYVKIIDLRIDEVFHDELKLYDFELDKLCDQGELK